MNDLNEKVYNTIKKLILESTWGKNVTQNELQDYLFSELYEFIDGVNKNDTDNMLEEAADVLMILLYTIIKNKNCPEKNIIEELISRIDYKLRTRYAIFFNDNPNNEDEEEGWIKSKYIEKEIKKYVFCPNPRCHYYTKTNHGNIVIEGNRVKCSNCKYEQELGSNNLILFKCKYRRVIFDTLDEYYLGFIKGGLYFADEYFSANRKDYIKVLRCIIANNSSSLALKEYFADRYNTSQDTFVEFLMYPLRNYLNTIKNRDVELISNTLGINEIMIKWINTDYKGLTNSFYKRKDNRYKELWRDYIQYLLKSIMCPILHTSESNDDFCNEKELAAAYLLKIELENTAIELKVINYSNISKLEIDISSCRTIVNVGQILMAIYLNMHLQQKQGLKFMLKNCNHKIDSENLLSFLTDLLPIHTEVCYK